VGQHLAIVSPKPQATRLPVTGIRTDGELYEQFATDIRNDVVGYGPIEALLNDETVTARPALAGRGSGICALLIGSQSIAVFAFGAMKLSQG